MDSQTIDVEWEEMGISRRLLTLKEWLAKHPDGTMWYLAWSLWWRILIITIGTFLITYLGFLLLWIGYE